MARIASSAIFLLFLLTIIVDVAVAESLCSDRQNEAKTEADSQPADWDQEDLDVSKSLKDALSRYNDAAPDGRQTKRLAMDVMILATVAGDTNSVNRMKSDLLQHYPSSVEAAYVLTTFPDGNKLREFLNAQFLKEIPDVQKARLAIRIIRQALPRFQKELLQDQGFALRLARAAFVADDQGLCKEARRVLNLNPARVAGVACDELTPPDERFRELQEMLLKDDFQSLVPDIRGFQQHLITLMSNEDRSNPEIRRMQARNHLQAGELELALVEFEFLKQAGNDPQIRFQHGACLARMRRSDDARTILKTIDADSAWKPSADAIVSWMDHLDDIIEQNAELMSEIIHAYRDLTLDICDLELVWKNKDGDHVTVTLGLDLIKSRIEIVATKNEIPLFGFQGLSTESVVYIKGEPAILRLPKMTLLPDVQLSNCHIDKTGFHGNTQINTGNSLNGLRKTFRELMHNEQMTSKATMTLLLGQMVRSGQFPRPLQSSDGVRQIHLAGAEIDRPGFTNSSLNIDNAGRLQSARFEWQTHEFEIRRVILSKWQDHQLAPGNWPDLPTRTLGDNDFGTVMRLAGSAFQLMANEMKPRETAEKPDEETTPLR